MLSKQLLNSCPHLQVNQYFLFDDLNTFLGLISFFLLQYFDFSCEANDFLKQL